MGMTQAEIDLIAARIMGWHKDADTPCWLNAEGFETHTYWSGPEIWNPSTSWADCGMLLDRLAELGYTFNLEHYPEATAERLSSFQIARSRPIFRTITEYAPDRKQAVARAALALAERMGK